MLKDRSLIGINDFSNSEIMDIMVLSQDIIKSPENFSNLCNGKILGTLFFEPSTRTRLSFESAIYRLGGSCIGFSESSSSSTSKGTESKIFVPTGSLRIIFSVYIVFP